VLRPAAFSDHMHLLYLDDSGSVGNPQDRHIILAGFSIFEREGHWLSKNMDELAEKIWPESPDSLEFRGADIRGGKKHWRGVGKEDRMDIYKEALTTLAQAKGVRIFGAVIHKAARAPDDPMDYAFEQVCNRFDLFLRRLHKQKDTQRGLIVLDKSAYETPLQGLARNFRSTGHRWGKLHNMAEVPLFVDSRATRLIQYANLVAYALRRYYENGDDTLSRLIAGKFDAVGGIIHGVTHFTPADQPCGCYCCRQRALLV
jgi:hypothetical protein